MKIIHILTLVTMLMLGATAGTSGVQKDDGSAQAPPPATGLVQVFDVTHPPYSAKGDGMTDDTVAIQQAIQDASDAGGGIVFFPLGELAEYLITDQITLKSGVSLVGVGQASRIKAVPVGSPKGDGGCDGEAGWAMFYGTAVDHVTIRNLVIYSTKDTDAAHTAHDAIVIHPGDGQSASDIAIEDSEIYGFKRNGIRTSGPQGAVKRLRVVNNYIHDLGLIKGGCGFGMQPNSVDGGYISGNFIENVTGEPIMGDGAPQDNIYWGIYTAGSSNLTIVRNYIQKCNGGIAFAGGERYTVMDNTINTTTASGHIGIQIRGDIEDIRNLEIMGNTILTGILSVFSATNLTITENVLDLQQVMLPNSGDYGAIRLGVDGPVNQVTVAHNRVTNGKGAHNSNTHNPTIQVFRGTDIAIINNEIAGFYIGINLQPAGTTNVTGIIVKDNKIQNIEVYYIYMRDTTEVTISGNRFEFSNGNGVGVAGIALDGGCSQITIKKNYIGPGGGPGISVSNSDVVVMNNRYYPDRLFSGNSEGCTTACGNIHITEWFPR